MSGADLYLAQSTLVRLLVYATAIGMGLGLVYDGLHILRMALGEPLTGQGRRPIPLAFLLFAEDIVFLLIAGVSLILLCYYANDGQLRAPAGLGMAGGFWIYRRTLSRPVLRVADRLLKGLRWMTRSLLGLVFRPLRRLYAVTIARGAYSLRERRTRARLDQLTRAATRGFDLLESAEPPKKENEKNSA